ncbi:MAG: molybdopterin-dependent oxidoreductase [Desulfobacterales bacterium]|nr:molybdopterin-dependent oxidoreductase [Desulfobacterales bacterium]
MPNLIQETPRESEDQWIPSFCMMCMQADDGTLVHVEDGVITNIVGNPDCPTNRGKICIRSISSIMGLYNPYRVKGPLKRTNPEKGPDIDPGWVEIPWEEAFNTVAEKLKKIREEDPRKLLVWEGWGCAESLFITPKEVEKATNYKVPGQIFADAFGTPNVVGSHGPLCSIHYASNLVHGQNPEYISDLQYCNYLIAPGRTVGPNVATPGSTRRFLEAIKRGMKLVTLDPRSSVEASKGFRWIPIRPGTELAFALSMIHTILYEIGKFDEWFVKNRTNGPYLIGPDGYYVRDPKSRKPLLWDSVEGKAKSFDDPSISDYVLEGEYEVGGVRTKPAFQLIKERVKEYTPEWAEKITSVPPETLRLTTREFIDHAMIGSTIVIDGFTFPYRPAQIAGSGRGAVSHKGGMYFDLATKIINMLVGAMEVPGGATGNRNPGPCAETLMPNEDGIVTPILEAIGVPWKFPPDHVDMAEFYPTKHTAPHLAVRAIVDPKEYYLTFPIETFLICGGNPIRAITDREIFIEAFKKVPFIVTVSTQFDETTMMADIVLPESYFLERKFCRFYLVVHQSIADDVRGLEMALCRNPVKPMFNTMQIDDIMLELADRAGFLKGKGGLNDVINRTFMLTDHRKLDLGKRYTLDEIIDRRIKQIFGDEHSFEEGLKKGLIYKYSKTGKEGYNYYYWPDNKTRHPIYFEQTKKTGDTLRENLKKDNVKIPGWREEEMEDFFAYFKPIPHWIPNNELDAPPEFDLWVVNWKTSLMPFATGGTQENPWLAELRERDPYEMFIHINKETAKKKGIKDGDWVEVESRYGKSRGKVKLTELIHPEVVGIPACYGKGTIHMDPVSKKGIDYNALITAKDNVGLDPLSGTIELSPKVKIKRLEGERG